VKIPSRRFFSNSALARTKASGVAKRSFKTANLSNCSLIKATLISRNAVSRTVAHTPIAMGA
jgi:hypothetical protein